MTQVALILGTRPETIKILPLARVLGLSCDLIAVTQHRELLFGHLSEYGLTPHTVIDIDRKTGSLSELSGCILKQLGEGRIAWDNYAYAVVQGDTATALASAQAAFYAGVPVVHVEAGLRSPSLLRPFPEEMHRRAISKIASYHFAPTRLSAMNLQQENVEGGIFQVGNTGIDAFRDAVSRPEPPQVTEILKRAGSRPVVLITCHRRESWSTLLPKLIELTAALPPDLFAVWPIHANPHIKSLIKAATLPSNVLITESLSHRVLAHLVLLSSAVVTDSGGVIEEAADADKPCLILRTETERPEALDAACQLVGDRVDELPTLVRAAVGWQRKSKGRFGDGHAANRIASVLLKRGTMQ